MPVSPFDRDANRRPAERRQEEPPGPAVRPQVRTSPREEREDPRAEDTPEEPGYGHGV